jgi:23S rRNA (cytidine1920-2'-O)/16S rRNA (cytidine1409-2'-O)-methyltransferase
MAASGKLRLDELLVELGFFPSRERARRAILAGLVEVAGRRDLKPGQVVSRDIPITALEQEPFVSRAGRKLAGALDAFRIDVRGWRCLDVGASTGGFTDCLLQRGALEVVALDVGHGLLDPKLRGDPRVTVVERTNARYLSPDAFPQPFDLITVDLSFISVRKVVPALLPHVASEGFLLILIKPQFEAGRGMVGKGGVIRDETVRQAVIAKTVGDLQALGLELQGLVDAAVAGASGNREAMAWFRRGRG